MKKILYTFFALCFMGISMADIDFTEAIQSTSMPTDAEIRAVLKQFEFNQEQENEVFKDVKRRLREMYSMKDLSKSNMELNQYYNQLDSEAVGVFMDNSTKQQLMRDMHKVPQRKSSK